jgi:hypothetical protein
LFSVQNASMMSASALEMIEPRGRHVQDKALLQVPDAV